VVLGGGGLLQDETSPFNLPFHLGRTHLSASGSRRVGVGLGVGPLRGWLGRALVRRSLSGAVPTSVRDAPSQDLLSSLGVSSLLAADLAVSLPYPRVEVEPRIGVSLRPWSAAQHVLPVGVRRRAPTVGAPPWFVSSAAHALDAVAARTGLAVHFVALQRDRDDAVHRQVAARMRSSATTAIPTVHTVVDELAACEAVIAMRYHAGIAALLGGRPAVLIGYSPKVSALAAEVPGGMAEASWDAQALVSLPATLDHVLGRGQAVVEGRERLREREARNDDVLDLLLGGPG
jgi:polysaccharide pyruvyl transferase WcaK-like protein